MFKECLEHHKVILETQHLYMHINKNNNNELFGEIIALSRLLMVDKQSTLSLLICHFYKCF